MSSNRFVELSDEQLRMVHAVCETFERALLEQEAACIESHLQAASEDVHNALFRELLAIELEWRVEQGEQPSIDEYQTRFPGEASDVHDVFRAITAESPPSEQSDDAATVDSTRGGALQTVRPKQIGRYRVLDVLGKGSFGIVYLAHDDQLRRDVAVKVPRAELISQSNDAEAYLAEARTVAKLDHPGIVPVYDVGSAENCPCYVVSKYIAGTDLATKLKQHQPQYAESVELVASVAEALHYAHKQGLVHRDVKPGNVLIDHDGNPHVVDFGLALREENIGRGPKFAGTPAYMSPEQARGEGHRVDGRSDIFSLGVVLYELLVGRKPFRGETRDELLEHVTSYEPRPVRQYDERLPKEVERICQKAMAKRATDRYSSAHDMAVDLRRLLVEHAASASAPGVSLRRTTESSVSNSPSSAVSSSSFGLGSSNTSQPTKIVPKGLRSFDAQDADFFVELLPGPCDRDGLPESLRFWKNRIEETNPDNTFAVGLIYGPSGCGKSSLVKAGLLPRISEDVVPIYIEATPDETEKQLLTRLSKCCTSTPGELSLKQTLALMRQGKCLPAGRKILIVLDQFEQWLHANQDNQSMDLVQALRQCDGGRVQCLLMVRDDFWLAVSRFLRELEVRLVEGQNSALVDLFDVDHAGRVLAAFGRAFGKLPGQSDDMTNEQKNFVKRSIAGLADERKVISVRLALFAEMMKSRTWTPATLKQVGGTSGVGVTFLEETFSAAKAPPEHRHHQNAARAVLNQLLPESGIDIKGHMRSLADLRQVCGYDDRPQDFEDLIRILDTELRLITPTDPDGVTTDSDSVAPSEPGQRCFQLTHDYLVPALRDWLTSKQRETRRGRVQLRLAQRALTWNAKPENRFLPSWWENVTIRLLTDKKHWTDPQRKMMTKAGSVHGSRSTIAVVLLIAVIFSGTMIRNATALRQRQAEASYSVDVLLRSETSQVEVNLQDLTDYMDIAGTELRSAYEKSAEYSNEKMHAALALLPEDESLLPYLQERLLSVSPAQFAPVRDLLRSHHAALANDYWPIVRDAQQDPARRFQAACALAMYEPQNESWRDKELREFLANHLVSVRPSDLLPWQTALRPVKQDMISSLLAIYRSDTEGEQVRSFATDVLLDYLSDDAEGIFDMLADAPQAEFALVFTEVAKHGAKAIELAKVEFSRIPADDASESDKVSLAMRQANAAIMMLRMNVSDTVWPLLKHSPDPAVRSHIIHWLNPRGVDPNAILERYAVETNDSIKRALLLCLGEFDPERIPHRRRDSLIESLLSAYRSEPDVGLRGASEWLLREWDCDDQIRAINQALRQNEAQRQGAADDDDRRWYVNSQGQTFAIIDAGQYEMGRDTPDHIQRDNPPHQRRIGRRIAIATTEVTNSQLLRFAQSVQKMAENAGEETPKLIGVLLTKRSDTPTFSLENDEHPAGGMSWYDATWYCNWLSEQEGIPRDQWCYRDDNHKPVGDGHITKENWLELTGYRLPTNAEWEFACRAETITSRYYGRSDNLLANYAWCQNNSKGHPQSVASLKPNDFGLFDMHGNVYEWCYDHAWQTHHFRLESRKRPDRGEEIIEDHPKSTQVGLEEWRTMRGGCTEQPDPVKVRSAHMLWNAASGSWRQCGFRPARTIKVLPDE